jgi:hypothetical protein
VTASLRGLVESPAVERLGWTLLHFLWEGVAIALLLAVALKLLRRRDARVRYWAACGAMALLAALPVVTYWMTPASAPTRGAAPVEIAPAVPVSQANAAPKGTPVPPLRNETAQTLRGMPPADGSSSRGADPLQARGPTATPTPNEAASKERWWTTMATAARRAVDGQPPPPPPDVRGVLGRGGQVGRGY